MLTVPIQSAVCVACFGIALPIAIALFPQMTQVSYHVTASLAFYNINYIIFFVCTASVTAYHVTLVVASAVW